MKTFTRRQMLATTASTLVLAPTTRLQPASAPTELWKMSALELARAIAARQISSREAVEAHYRRIEAVNGEVNAVTVLLREEALAAADEADRAVRRGDELPRCTGFPPR
jgi:Asp-tRNA(Asn)/Glu-tRNA(Gln) amidotransferase A subunit family amidase